MRILAMSDLHGNHEIYERIPGLTDRHRADALVLAGDLLGAAPGFTSIEDAQEADAAAILPILQRVTVPIICIMGNDDMIELKPTTQHVRLVHGRRVEFGDFNFVGYQYSLPFMAGVFEKPEVELARDLAALEPLMDEGTVLVTHSPALGSLDLGMMGEPIGSPSILRVVQSRKVRAHIHGHAHSSFGREGIHFNVASGGRRLRGMVLDLTTMEHKVVDEGDIAWGWESRNRSRWGKGSR